MRNYVLALCLLISANVLADSSAEVAFVEGKQYVAIEGEPSLYRGGKVNVREFFLYGCPHCYDFQPVFSRWLGERGGEVELELYPVVLAPAWFPFYGKSAHRARMHYSLDQMGVHELGETIFAAIHELKMDLGDKEEIADFVASLGVNKEEFLRTYSSSATDELIETTLEMRKKYGVSHTPTVVVDGRFMTSFEMADNNAVEFMNIVDALVEKVKAEHR